MASLFSTFFVKSIRYPLATALTLCMFSCTSIDCPLDSVVVMTLSFHDSELEEETALPCTLNIEAPRAGLLFNTGTDIKSLQLPLNTGSFVDTLYLKLSDNDRECVDTLYVNHTNESHFEAMDCPGAVFHRISSLQFLPHPTDGEFPVTIDSVSIIRPLVDYNDVENVRIYYHISADIPAIANARH